jgi:fructose-bisphosphate aldolase, class I
LIHTCDPSFQIVNCYSGRIGLINSEGGSKGATDLAEAIKTAVINKRAGGSGMIMGLKAFQRPFSEGVALIQAVQEIYLAEEVSIA